MADIPSIQNGLYVYISTGAGFPKDINRTENPSTKK